MLCSDCDERKEEVRGRGAAGGGRRLDLGMEQADKSVGVGENEIERWRKISH